MSCTSGKQTYSSRGKAKAVCKKLKGLGRGNLLKPCSVKLTPYKCRVCNMWHLTSSGKFAGRSDTGKMT